MYNSDYPYVLIDINDSQMRQDDPLAHGWKDDSVEFYFDGNNSKGGRGGGRERHGAIQPDDSQYRFPWNVNRPDSYNYEYFHRPRSLEDAQQLTASAKTGYRLNIRFPWRPC